MSEDWRNLHHAGKLIPCHWDLQPVFMMLETGVWDESCTATLEAALNSDSALVGFTLMLFGAHYSTDVSTITKICDHDKFVERIKSMLSATTSVELQETVRVAMEKAVRGDH